MPYYFTLKTLNVSNVLIDIVLIASFLGFSILGKIQYAQPAHVVIPEW